MNKKMITIFICSLLLSTVIIATAGINNNRIFKKIDNFPLFIGDDVPTWDIDYSWTYTGEMSINEKNLDLNILLNEAYFGIVNNTGDTYTVVFGGDIDGMMYLKSPIITLKIRTGTGTFFMDKSNLGFKRLELFFTGTDLIPFSMPATAKIILEFDPVSDFIDFPLEVGKTWVIPETEVTFDVEIVILGIFKKIYNLDNTAEEKSAECIGKEMISTALGTYQAYNISYDGVSVHYCPTVGNIIKIMPVGDKLIDFNMEIIATSYPSSNNPLKPETPSGPISRKLGTTYEFTTKAVDPNGDQIKYGWDWNGDFVPDSWTDFYDSNVEISTQHVWEEQGDFDIRVRARDTNGRESIWSDPLPVSVPSNTNNQQLNQNSITIQTHNTNKIQSIILNSQTLNVNLINNLGN